MQGFETPSSKPLHMRVFASKHKTSHDRAPRPTFGRCPVTAKGVWKELLFPVFRFLVGKPYRLVILQAFGTFGDDIIRTEFEFS